MEEYTKEHDGNNKGLLPEDQALQDMQDIREAQYERAVDRLTQFEEQANPTLTRYNGMEKQTVWFDKDDVLRMKKEPMTLDEKKEWNEALDPTDTLKLDNDLDFTEDVLDWLRQETRSLAKERSNGHNQAMQEPNPEPPNDVLTDEQMLYIMEVEERAGIEFNDYEEVVEWELNEYGDNDISQDDSFDMDR